MRRVSILALFMVCTHCGLANIYYVSISGNDNGDGSQANPWRTLRAAVSKVPAAQGHTIKLSPGTFVESGSFNVPPGVNIEGSGIDQTIIKAASSFHFNPGDPGFALDKFLMTLNSAGFSEGNQTVKNFTIDGEGKRLHGGIYVKNRNRIAIENVKVKETNFCGIWIWDVRNSTLRQITLINCSWGSTGWASGALQLAHLESVEISGLNIDENTGYGIKALSSGGNKITRMKLHDSRISVNPVGKWNNGSAPNIAFELWEVYLTDCEIYNTYMDNHLSLVNVQTPPTGGRSIRVHHNVFDLLERAGGHGYAIELSINDAEIDNNWIKGGSYGIAHWSPAYCANWSIHHNTFHSLSSGYPGDIVRAQVSGLHNVRFYNNTVELMGTATINVIGLHAGSSSNIDLKNNLIINSNTSYAWFPNQLVFLERGASVSGLSVGNNLLDKLPLGSVAGTYTNNLQLNCKITQSGSRPNPYYLPTGGSPLIDAGVNVGFPFKGSAPDIGAHEFASASAPTNQLPVISITAPANDARFSKGESVTISADASDKDGTVSKIEFYNGTVKLGEDTSTPYSFDWKNVAAGSHTLTAKAIDNSGGITTSAAVKVEVVEPVNALPVVSITAPAHEARFSKGESVTISADASDKDGTVSKIEFYNGTVKLGEDTSTPYSFEWNNVAAGSYTLTAKAIDNAGGITTSAAVRVEVVEPLNALPVVSITSPANNTSLSKGGSVLIAADASDEDGVVTKVEFYNGTVKLGEDATSPYAFEWKDISEGTHTLSAKVTDNSGGSATSPAVKIEVKATANGLPTVAITSPQQDATFAALSSVIINANASDPDGIIAKVEFFKGTEKLGEDSSLPFSFTWNDVPAGSHSLTARATDNLGGNTTSAAVTIIVTNSNLIPVVALTSPAEGAVFNEGSTIEMSANATDADGKIVRVEFFSDDIKIGEDVTSPYTLTWKSATKGEHRIVVKATDDKDEIITSNPVTITVNSIEIVENAAPTITIASPQDNAIYSVGQPIVILTEVNGYKKGKVEFFNGTSKIGEDATVPFSLEWKGAPDGDLLLKVKLVDNAIPVSADEVSITVLGNPTANAGQDVLLSYPSNSVQLSGAGMSADGSEVTYSWEKISGPDDVSFSDNNSDSPVLNNLAEGIYIIELTVTDPHGGEGRDQVKIHVSGSDVQTTAIPRYFTPNDDGINDIWEWPDVEKYADSPLTIFNRAGQKIYEAESYNNSWDGTMSGKPLQADAYYYVIRSKGGGDIKGAVRIVR